MSIQINNVSKRLKSKEQWICWQTKMRDGKETKLPVDPNTQEMAATDDPSTWGSVMDAYSAYQENEDLKGIGFVFTADDPFVGIDLDDCRDTDTEEWESWALDILDDVDGFREISPSGTGGHIITIGEIPGDRNRKGSVEIYEDTRYFTVTGDIIDKQGKRTDDIPSVKESQYGLDAVYDRFLADDDDGEANETNVDVDLSDMDHLDLGSHGDGPTGTYTSGGNLESLPNEEQEIIEAAKGSRNGYKFTQLWRGNWKDVYPGESHSEADMGFCDMLAFWCSGDPERMDRVFRASGLMRQKWDEKRYSDGSTYGERTIQRAVAKVDDYYDPEHYEDIVDDSSGDDDDTDGGSGPDSGREETTDAAAGDAEDSGSDAGKDTDSEQNEDSAAGGESGSEASTSVPGGEESSRSRSRADRADSPFLPAAQSGSTDEHGSDESATAAVEQEASDSEPASSDGEPVEDNAEPDVNRGSANRRTRGEQNRGGGVSEFQPVNVGSGADSASASVGNGESVDSDSTGSGSGDDDSGSGFFGQDFDGDFEREFDGDEDYIDEALDEGDSTESPEEGASDDDEFDGMGKDEAKDIFSGDSESKDQSSTTSSGDEGEDVEKPVTEGGGEDGGEDEEAEDYGKDEDEIPNVDSSESANGQREIPGELDQTLTDLNSDLERLGSNFEEFKDQYKNELEKKKDDIQLLKKELKYYEDIVDEQAVKIEQLEKVVQLLCQYQEHPLFDSVEEALQEGDEIPVEDVIDASVGSADSGDSHDRAHQDGTMGGRGQTMNGDGDWGGRKSQRQQDDSRTSQTVASDGGNGSDEDDDLRDKLSRFF